MTRWHILGAFLITLAMPGLTTAEVIELKTGQRIEGSLVTVSQDEVVIDVAGQKITLNRDKVAVIYFVRPSAAARKSPTAEAIRILKGLQSATEAGVTYRDYAPRVTDAKIQLDRLISDMPDGPAKREIVVALAYYVYAASVWNAKITRPPLSYKLIALRGKPLIAQCQQLKNFVDRYAGRGVGPGAAILDFNGVSTIWSCARDRLRTAEKIVREGAR